MPCQGLIAIRVKNTTKIFDTEIQAEDGNKNDTLKMGAARQEETG